jgi:hypothetical protein
MYREPPPVCCVCGDAVEAHAADVTEAGLRCRRCGDAAELAAVQPALAEWDTHCLRCVLASWLPDEE